MDILIVHDRDRDVRSEIALETVRVFVGSDPGNDVVIAAQGVAPLHCVLEWTGESWRVLDRGSDQGTLVNGAYVEQETVGAADRIEIGSASLRIVRRAGAAQPAPGAAPSAPSAPSASLAPPRPARPARAARAAAPMPDAEEYPDEVVFLVNESPEDVADDGTRSGVRSGIRRARRRRSGKLAVAGGLAAVGAVVAFVVVPALTRRDGAAAAPRDSLALAAAWRETGEFARARSLLVELAAARLDDPPPDAVRAEMQLIDRDESRSMKVARLLQEIEASPHLAPHVQLERVEQGLRDFADLPEAVRLGSLKRSIEQRIREREAAAATALPDRASRAAEKIAAGEFGAARAEWAELAKSELETDRFAAANGVALVEAAAGAAVDEMLKRAEDALAKDDVAGAVTAFREDRIAGIRGTSRFAEVETFAAMLNARVAADSGPARPAAPAHRPVATAKPPGVTRMPDDLPPRDESADGPATRPTNVEKIAIRDGDALFLAGDVVGARQHFEATLRSATPPAKAPIERRIERARRAEAFLSTLLGKIGEAPQAVAAVAVKAKDGAAGHVTGVSHGTLAFEAASGARDVSPADLAPAACLALARKFTWTPAESLDRAAFAMCSGDEKEIDAALVRAVEDDAQKRSVDQLIALWRGMEEIPEWGFFRQDGEWISFAERERRQYDKQVKAAVARLEQGDKAYDHGIELLNELLPVAKERIAKELQERRKRMLASIASAPEWKALDRLYVERRRLEDARKHALELIFDEVKYFYPYSPPDVPPDLEQRYHEVQREVDERVDKVRAIWGDEHGDAPPGITLGAQFSRTIKSLAVERGILAVADPEHAGGEPETERLELVPAGIDRMTIRDVALDLAERARLDQDRQVLAYNATATSSGAPEELDQIRITNEYRRMMGRRALAVHEKLMRSARGHSQWMSRTGKMTHFNDEDPKLRTPGDRIRAQGYVSGGSGENVAKNNGGSSGAHAAWIHSSGHHRNILWEGHTEMGVGNMGVYWTQNFAGGTDYIGNLVGDDG